jgi:hypothetical protein
MKTQFRLIDRRLKGVSRLLDETFADFDSMKKDVFKAVASKVVEFSPVDTGTYMDAHNITIGRSSSSTDMSSKGKARKRPRGPHETSALARLNGQIDAMSAEDKSAFIGNSSHHGMVVEYGGPKTPAYAPYTRAREASKRIIASVLMGYGRL